MQDKFENASHKNGMVMFEWILISIHVRMEVSLPLGECVYACCECVLIRIQITSDQRMSEIEERSVEKGESRGARVKQLIGTLYHLSTK